MVDLGAEIFALCEENEVVESGVMVLPIEMMPIAGLKCLITPHSGDTVPQAFK